MTIKTLSPKQTEFILIGATGKLGKSITENNIITYGICSKKNPLVGKKIDRIKEPLLSSFEEINLEKVSNSIVIDASYPENFDRIHEFCLKNKIPLILASTGHSDNHFKKLEILSKNVPVLRAPNLSEGIAFFKSHILKPIILNINAKTSVPESENSVKTASDLKIKIIETHHDQKKDAPSGTALDIKNYISKGLVNFNEEIKIESIRDKSSIGKHEVTFTFQNEEILVSHNALSRNIFAQGISLAESIIGKKPGIYSMVDLIEDF
jgi:4-hydroxy-tetrahydrodipicolinate reductase